MPDALVAVVIVIAIFAVIRGDAPLRDVVKIGTTLLVISAVGLAILYIPPWLYETVSGRNAPTWLTVVSAIPALILALATYFFVTLPRSTRPSQQNTAIHDQ